jgi:Flp pilus assembly protein TadG
METRITQRRSGGSDGQALTEFALIAPVLFLVFFAIIQFGFLFGGQNALVNGVRDAARYASTYRVADAASAAKACSAVKSQLTNNLRSGLPGFAASRLHAAISYAWYANPDGTYSIRVQVSARYDHPLFVPLVGNIVDGFDGANDGAFTIGASEQMRVENPALTTNGGSVTCS